jgi:hypothetical protein
MKRVIAQALVGLIAAGVLAYAGDYAILRFRIWHKLDAYGSVSVQVYYAVPQKNGKTEYDFQSSKEETCVKSIFPHLGDRPCWYARTHRDREINL